jgi:hypothetical protein
MVMASGEKLTNVEKQRRYRDRRNLLADSADLKPLTLRGAALVPGTRDYAHYALAFLLALERDGKLSCKHGSRGLMVRLSADKNALPKEARTAAWKLKDMIGADDKIDVTVYISPRRQRRVDR